jgi:hypothetical protein
MPGGLPYPFYSNDAHVEQAPSSKRQIPNAGGTPEITSSKHQIPDSKYRNAGAAWDIRLELSSVLVIGICLGFGIWNLGFPLLGGVRVSFETKGLDRAKHPVQALYLVRGR